MSLLTPADVQGTVYPGRPKHRPRRKNFASWLEPQDGLYSLTARPVFSVGSHKGETYTKADLAAMVEAFEPTINQLKPRVKLGHDDAQAFAKQASPGTPALGFVADLYLNEEYTDRFSGKTVPAGTQVLADFVNIPRELAEPLKRLSYPERSVELLVNYADKEQPGKTWPLALRNIAFLGDELPGVRGLPPLVEMFDDPALVTRIVTFSGDTDMAMDPNAPTGEAMPAWAGKIEALLQEILGVLKAKAEEPEEMAAKDKKPDEELAAKPAAEAEKVPVPPAAPVVQQSDPAADKRFSELEDRAKAAEAKAQAAQTAVNVMQQARESEAREAECRQFVESLNTEKAHRFPKKAEPRLVYLLANAPNGSTRAFSEDGGKTAATYADTLRSVLSEIPAVDLTKTQTRNLSDPQTPTATDMVSRATALAKEKGLNFAEALTTVTLQLSGGDADRANDLYVQLRDGAGN